MFSGLLGGGQQSGSASSSLGGLSNMLSGFGLGHKRAGGQHLRSHKHWFDENMLIN